MSLTQRITALTQRVAEQFKKTDKRIDLINPGDKVVAALSASDFMNKDTYGAPYVRLIAIKEDHGYGGGMFKRKTWSVGEEQLQQHGFIYRSKDGYWYERIVEPDYISNYVEDALTAVKEGNLENVRINLQHAIDWHAWRGMKFVLPKKSYFKLSGRLYIPSRLTEFDGNDSILEFEDVGNVKSHGVYSYNNDQHNVNPYGFLQNCHIHNLNITHSDGKTTEMAGLYLTNVRNVKVYNCNVKSRRYHGIIFLMDQGCTWDMENNEAYNNTIRCSKEEDDNTNLGIAFHVHPRISTGEKQVDGVYVGIGMDEYWNTKPSGQSDMRWKVAEINYSHLNAKAYNNNVYNFRYGIVNYYGKDFEIHDNLVKQVTRGIVCQDNCIGGMVNNNTIVDNKSSAILLNYGCSDIIVDGNRAVTSIGEGQAYVHMSVQAQNITVSNNSFVNKSTAKSPKWGIYVGVKSNDIKIVNNSIAGNILRAYVVVESNWKKTWPTEAWLYSHGDSPKYGGWTSRDTYNIEISGNSFVGEGSAVGIALAALNSTNQDGTTEVGTGIRTVKIHGNIFTSPNMGRFITFTEDTNPNSKISDVSLGENIFPKGAQNWKFQMISKDRFSRYGICANRPDVFPTAVQPNISDNSAGSFTEKSINEGAEGRLIVGQHQMYYLNAGGGTNKKLKEIHNGKAGQYIKIRGFSGMTILNSNNIRLQEQRSITLSDRLDSNKIITLICISGSGTGNSVWTEVSRNFNTINDPVTSIVYRIPSKYIPVGTIPANNVDSQVQMIAVKTGNIIEYSLKVNTTDSAFGLDVVAAAALPEGALGKSGLFNMRLTNYLTGSTLGGLHRVQSGPNQGKIRYRRLGNPGSGALECYSTATVVVDTNFTVPSDWVII